MKGIRVIYRDVRGSNASDITDIIENMTISTTITSSAGKCDMEIVGDGASFHFGSCINVFDGDVEVFRGYLFSVSMQSVSQFSATFYDQTRYLRNVDCVVYKKITASDLFKRICKENELETGVIDESEYILPATVSEGKSLWDTIQETIELEAAYKKRLFVVRDVAGKLEFRDIENLRTDLIINDEGIAMGFDVTRGIDKNSYNRVKLGFEDENSSSRRWAIKENSDYLKEWGRLQYYQLLRDRIPLADLDIRSEQQLALLCWPTTDVRLSCLGDFKISAGNGVMLDIESVQMFKGMSGFYVVSCDHHISHALHTMDLTLAVDNFGG